MSSDRPLSGLEALYGRPEPPRRSIMQLYGAYETSYLPDKTKRELIHSAYWIGVGLSKHFGSLKTSAADNRVLGLAFLQGFLAMTKEMSP